MRTPSLIPWRRAQGLPQASNGWPMNDIYRDVTQLMDDMMKSQRGFLSPLADEGAQFGALDLSEKDNAFHLSVDLPGVQQKDIDLEISGNRLVLHARRERHEEEKAEGFHQVERSFGAVTRQVMLPDEVDPDRVDAHFRDGVLNVTIPKTESAKERSRKIRIGN